MKCSLCLNCGKFICDKKACFKGHATQCNSKDSFYVFFKNGRVCLHVDQQYTASQCVYFNTYGESFEEAQLKNCDFLLDTAKLDAFLQHYVRGDVIQQSSFRDDRD